MRKKKSNPLKSVGKLAKIAAKETYKAGKMSKDYLVSAQAKNKERQLSNLDYQIKLAKKQKQLAALREKKTHKVVKNQLPADLGKELGLN